MHGLGRTHLRGAVAVARGGAAGAAGAAGGAAGTTTAGCGAHASACKHMQAHVSTHARSRGVQLDHGPRWGLAGMSAVVVHHTCTTAHVLSCNMAQLQRGTASGCVRQAAGRGACPHRFTLRAKCMPHLDSLRHAAGA